MDTFRNVVDKNVCLPSEKGSTQKGKNLLPKRALSFLVEYTPLQKRHGVQVSKTEVTKNVSIVKMAENLPNVSSPLVGN